MLQEGDKVKFKDNLWEEKKALGAFSFLCPPLAENAPNIFTVIDVNIMDVDDIEIQLEEFPWLVYEEELEKIVS